MLQIESCNCIVCASEFNLEEMQNHAFSKINLTQYKICKACLDMSDPSHDYAEAIEVVNLYLCKANSKLLFAEANDLIKSVKNK